jgi:hypothetical protein
MHATAPDTSVFRLFLRVRNELLDTVEPESVVGDV